MTVVVGIGTVKGGWIASSDDRVDWTVQILDGELLND